MAPQLRPADPLQSDGFERQPLGVAQATKSLPRLPRGWTRVCHESGLFLRSIGLGILVTAFQGFFTNNFSEPEKVAIRQSRVTALLRALIHAWPLGLAIFEIIINWKGHYVGPLFDKQNYLQFVAKAHEILMQASIATIVLSYIRYQVSAGKGMPFGAVLGALQFFQIGYLWSVEFWSAIVSKDFQLRKKICFAVLIVICITIAATAGPSSANLLIARQGTWPRKSNYLSVNATFQDIWPDRLDGGEFLSVCELKLDSRLDGCSISNLDIFGDDMVYPLILRHYNNQNLIRFSISDHGQSPVRNMLAAPCFENSLDQVCLTVQQETILAGLLADSEAHYQDDTEMALQGYHTLKENYYQPYAAASCVADTVLNSSDKAPLRFVRLSEKASELQTGRETFSVPGLMKGQSTYKIPGNTSQFRVDWVDLPQETFGTGVPGAIIVHPQSSTSLSYNVTTCTLNAGWGSSSLLSNNADINDIESHITQLPPSWPNPVIFPIDVYGISFTERPIFSTISNFSYPQLHINISKSWMESINPTITLLDNSTINAISVIMAQLSSEPKEYELALVLNIFLVTALSSHGVKYDSQVFKERAHASESCETCIIFEIENSIYGWQYNSRGTTTKLAIAVMLAYCILVVAHLIYSAVSGVSSTAWDSVAELVALAMNSSPTEALQNTCAGIVGKKGFQTHVRVMKTSEKHLELVFGEVQDPNADISKLIMNEKYGSIAEGKKDEDEALKLEGQGEIRKRALVKPE